MTLDIGFTLDKQRKLDKFSEEEIEQKEVAYEMWRNLILALRDREDHSLGLEPPPIQMEDLEMHGVTGIEMDDTFNLNGSFQLNTSNMSEGEKIMFENWKVEERKVEDLLDKIDEELADIAENIAEIYETLKLSNDMQMDYSQNMKEVVNSMNAKRNMIREKAKLQTETRATRSKRILEKCGPIQNFCLNSIAIMIFLWITG